MNPYSSIIFVSSLRTPKAQVLVVDDSVHIICCGDIKSYFQVFYVSFCVGLLLIAPEPHFIKDNIVARVATQRSYVGFMYKK